MSFDSLETCQTYPEFIVWRGKQHKLLITPRNIPETPLSAEQWQALIEATKGLWMRVATLYDMALQAVANSDIPKWEMDTTAPHKKVMQQDGITPLPRTVSPHVTVCNFDYDNPTFTVVSNESAESAVVMMHGMLMAQAHMREIMPTLYEGVTMPYRPTANKTVTTPDNVIRIGANADTQPDKAQRNTVQTDVIPLRGFVRSTKAGQFAGSISIESGKPDAPNFKTQARLADKLYHAKEVQYPHGAIVAYEISGLITVGEWEGQRTIDIPLKGGGSFRQFDDSNKQYPKWTELVQKLGIVDALVTPGAKFQLRADYLVLKCESETKDGTPLVDKNKNPVSYKKFYGFYLIGSANPPAQDTAPDLSYFDTEASDSPSDYQPDVEPFPF